MCSKYTNQWDKKEKKSHLVCPIQELNLEGTKEIQPVNWPTPLLPGVISAKSWDILKKIADPGNIKASGFRMVNAKDG